MIILLAIGMILIIGFFVIKSIVVCKMAKKRGFKNWWLGMIPYANYYIIGKLVGKTQIFNLIIKNVGLIAMISAIVYDIFNVAILLYYVQFIFELNWAIQYFANALLSISYAIDLIFYASFFLLVSGLFGRYAPHKRILYTVLCLLAQYMFNIQFMFPILLLIIRNNRPYESASDYYAEQMAKRYGQTYNPFARPYSTKENPFNDSNGVNNENQAPNEDPFDEFK